MTVEASEQQQLLTVARGAIGHGLEHAKAPAVRVDDYPAALCQAACTFVTLRTGEALRGCIGSLRAYRPLVADVAGHAYGAAFSDGRFSPLQHAELAGLHIHIAILSPLQPLDFDGDDNLLTLLRPNIDGLLIQSDHRRATFLPTVWSSFPGGREFLAALKKKAGMAIGETEYKAWYYTTQDFEETRP